MSWLAALCIIIWLGLGAWSIMKAITIDFERDVKGSDLVMVMGFAIIAPVAVIILANAVCERKFKNMVIMRKRRLSDDK